MAGITGLNTSVSAQYDIPEVWSDYYVDFLTRNLVAAKLFRDFSGLLKNGGDKI